jgi:hypothetical protein
MIQKASDDLLWSQVVATAWCDEVFRNRLLSAPRAVLAEHGLEVPEDVEVEVAQGEDVTVEDAGTVRRFTFTPCPPDELSEEDLFVSPMAQCFSAVCAACAACGRCGACACRCACRCF